MKNILALISFLTLINTAYGECNTTAIIYKKSTGFGLSFGSGKSSTGYDEAESTNVPLSINGDMACFKKVSAFSMKSETKKGKSNDTIVITPMKTEFENIPSPHQEQYIIVESNPNKMLTKLHVMRFICSGEVPLSIEATSDSVLKIKMDTKNVEMNVSNVFATGIAAQNLNKGKKDSHVSKETFAFFTKFFQSKNQAELKPEKICITCNDFKIPSIISETTVQSFTGVERAIASSFTTMAQNVPNGCSRTFSETMSNYKLENFKINETFTDYKISKKKSNFVIEW